MYVYKYMCVCINIYIYKKDFKNKNSKNIYKQLFLLLPNNLVWRTRFILSYLLNKNILRNCSGPGTMLNIEEGNINKNNSNK